MPGCQEGTNSFGVAMTVYLSLLLNNLTGKKDLIHFGVAMTVNLSNLTGWAILKDFTKYVK